MVRQYPHTMTFVSGGGDSTQDGNGNWIPGAAGTETSQPCRSQINSAGAMVSLTDGRQYQWSNLVNMPLSSLDVPEGAMVTITDAQGNVKVNRAAVLFDRGQLNCRLWL